MDETTEPAELTELIEDPRILESQEIEERLEAARQRPQFPYLSPSSPLVTRAPKTHVQYNIDPATEEAILFNYAMTASLKRTAEQSGVGVDKVRSVVYSPASREAIGGLREQLRVSVLQKIEETQTALLDAILDPLKLEKANLSTLSTVFAEITDKHILLAKSAQETSGLTAQLATPTDVFSGDELEYMSLLRGRLSRRGEEGGSPALAPTPISDVDPGYTLNVTGHEILDPSFSVGLPEPPPEPDEEDRG